MIVPGATAWLRRAALWALLAPLACCGREDAAARPSGSTAGSTAGGMAGNSAPAGAAPSPPPPVASPAPARRGQVVPLAREGLAPNDSAVIAEVERRLARSGHSFVAHRIPIEQKADLAHAAGADLEVTYVGLDIAMQVIVLVVRDPQTARGMAPVLSRKAVPSSTWVLATWSGKGVLMLVSDTGPDDQAGAAHVRRVVAALSSNP